MSLPAPNFHYNMNHLPNFDRILAPVPLRRTQPFPNFSGYNSRIDGTIAPGTWKCGCANSFGPPYGDKDSNTTIVDPNTVQGGAFFSTVNCTGKRGQCDDQRALSYDVNAETPEALACIYPNATAMEDCSMARSPPNGCNHAPYRPYSF